MLFRQSCQECGHYASDHRELTAVDKYIKAQVSSGKRKKCTSLISPSEIPMSPVFDRYDLISIPYREPTSNKVRGRKNMYVHFFHCKLLPHFNVYREMVFSAHAQDFEFPI